MSVPINKNIAACIEPHISSDFRDLNMGKILLLFFRISF